MITDGLQYLLHIAPSLAVVVALVWAQNERLNKMENRISDMLEMCQAELFNHLNGEH